VGFFIDMHSLTLSKKKISKLPLLPAKALTASQIRYLNLHEYQSKQLMAKHNINVQRFAIAETVDQAKNAALGLSMLCEVIFSSRAARD